MDKNKQRIERLMALVDEMREHSQEMRQWRNVALAREGVELLRAIDDPEETPMGKALACEALVGHLPEYDVPRFVLGILRYKLELIRQSEERDPDRYPTEEEVTADIRRLEDYIDTEHLSTEAFRERYNRSLRFDPVERTAEWEAGWVDVEREVDRRLGDTPRGMGFCFSYWGTLRQVLGERGIEWHTPSELNPRVMFD